MTDASIPKPGATLSGLAPEMLGAVLTHPVQRAVVARITELITWLRDCDKPEDFYDFQKHLFGDVHQMEERRSRCRQTVRRLESRKAAPAEAIELIGVTDPADVDEWQFELFMYERLTRQFRTVGDALAWRSLGFDRRVIIALSSNASAGPMYNKAGLPYELGAVEQAWKTDRQFALLHDLTNCLRIGDLSQIVPGGMTWLREVKAKAHTDSRQMMRAQRAIDAMFSGGPLPGSSTQFVQLDTPYEVSLSQLGDAVRLAKARGVQGMKLPQGRALLVTSVAGSQERFGDRIEDAPTRHALERAQAIRRAGIDRGETHHITGLSADTAARSPHMVPFALYPLAPEDCAALICDFTGFEVIVSAGELVRRLQDRGLRAELVLPPKSQQLPDEGDILRVSWNGRLLTFHNRGVGQFIYELLEPNTWADGVAETLRMDQPPFNPLLIYRDEAARAGWR